MKYLKIITLVLTLILIASCTKKEPIDLSEGMVDDIMYSETTDITNFIKIETSKDEVIIIELLPEYAPITVENFQNLVEKKFYDESIFHRVIEGFMIQGGQSATGEEVQTIKGEFKANGIENNLLHERGVISMARLGDDMDSATSQFFIMHQDNPGLDGEYASFGKVIAGMDVVDRIATTRVDNPASMAPKPVVNQVIRTIRFVTIEE